MPGDNSFGGLTVREAGRLGGLVNLAKHGREHFSKIGKQGQRALRKRYPGKASKWGKQGGRPRKPKLCDMGDQETNCKEDADPPLGTDPPPTKYKC